MAITTLDGVLAGCQKTRFFNKLEVAGSGSTTAGRPMSCWSHKGIPGPGTYHTTAAGVILSSTGGYVAGMIPRSDPISGNAYLACFNYVGVNSQHLLLCDRLWHNGGLNAAITTPQTINSVTWPARDENGSTNGVGVYIALEVSSVMGAGTPTLTLAYTNSDGVATRSATNVTGTVTTSAKNSFYIFGLQSGDVGVRSIQSLTLSATWTSGTMNLVAFRVLAYGTSNSSYPFMQGVLSSGMPRIYNGTVPFIVSIPLATGTPMLAGTYVETHG
jgi:hypothetical protein